MEEKMVCRTVSKSLGSFSLKDITFELPKGNILGVIGRNGCGKTSLLRTLMGLYRLEDGAGDIRIDDISVCGSVKEYKAKIAYVLSDFPFSTGYTAAGIGDLYGRYYKGYRKERYLEYLKAYQVKEKERFLEMSQGEKLRAQLAFALSLDARVYILDEPTGNLDPAFRDEFYQAVRELVRDGEKSVIYATHLIEELEGLADYLLWMKREEQEGRIRYFGRADELTARYRMIEGSALDEAGLVKELAFAGELVGGRKRESHTEFLVRLSGDGLPEALKKNARYADLKEIMYYEEKGGMV